MSVARRGTGRATRRWSIRLAAAGLVYAVLLAADLILAPPPAAPRTPGDAPAVDTPAFNTAGQVPGGPVRVAYRRWPAGGPTDALPLVLLHGSPGDSGAFRRFAAEFAGTREVVAPDLPGFGRSTRDVPDYSTRAHARYVLAMLDELAIPEAHVLGWSMGAGVAIDMAEIDPGRVRSLTLMSSIGAQATEGSGSYLFEHAKYAAGYAALVGLPEFVPHFGLLDPLRTNRFWLRNFFDTDQRPMAGIMRTLETPVMIVHGRRDFLVADHAAIRHHRIMPTSRLVITPGDHFIPFLGDQPAEVAALLAPFLARHDDPAAEPDTGTLDLSPMPPRVLFDLVSRPVRALPWWLALAGVAIGAWRRPHLTAGVGAVFVADLSLDIGLFAAGLLLGQLIRSPAWWEQSPRMWPARVLWTGVVTAAAFVLTAVIVMSGLREHLGMLTAAALAAATAALSIVFSRLPTREGRQRLLAGLRRLTHHEWWPSWMLYLPLAPTLAGLAIRHRGVMVWTAANPGVNPGGGVIGERKLDVLRGFKTAPPDVVLRGVPLPRGGTYAERTAEAIRLIDRELGGLPAVLKPETGFKGVGVKVARTPADLEAFIRHTSREAHAQAYHAGPHEIGVLWARRPETVGHEDDFPPPHGEITAITRKVFPEVEGDGRRTLRRLIMDHPRYRVQAPAYFRHNAAQLDLVVPAGVAWTLSRTGNHTQGCIFRDGADLLTPALAERIDRIMRTWRGDRGEPFDVGRLDIRYADEAELREGRGFAVVELNGVTGEPTNIYDPDRSMRSALGVLREHWIRVFALGAARRTLGRRPMSLGELLVWTRRVRNRSAI